MAGIACKFMLPFREPMAFPRFSKRYMLTGVSRCNLFTLTQMSKLLCILANPLEEFKKSSVCIVVIFLLGRGRRVEGEKQTQKPFGRLQSYVCVFKLTSLSVYVKQSWCPFCKLQMPHINRMFLNIFNIFTLVERFIKGFLFWK